MQVGDLVRIRFPGIGRPAGTLALALSEEYLSGQYQHGTKIWRVELIGYVRSGTTQSLTGRYREGDLEIVSESR